MSLELKKFTSIIVVLAMVISLCLPSETREVNAAAATYYVATIGSDSNPGTSALPFRTIQKAAQIMLSGDTCLIQSGTYRETVTPANSGTIGQPITFKADTGATVVVSGTEPISGWTQHSGNIYQANLSWSLGQENQLVVNNGSAITPLWEARWPNIGAYSFPELRNGMATMQQGSSTTIVDSSLTQANGFWNGATVWERGGDGYLAQTTTVSSFDAATHTLNLNAIPGNASYLEPSANSNYYLSGVLGALDAANEWYVDSAAGKVYLWAPGGGVPSNIEVKKRFTAFDLNDKSYINLTGIQTFAANIQMNNANNNVLDGIQAQYLYFSSSSQGYYPGHQDNSGIAIFGSNNEIRNSTIAYSTGTLVKIAGDNNRIINNNIHDGDYMSSYASLIVLESGTQNLISHNTLSDAGRSSIYWKRGSAVIEYNNIYNGMWLSRDGGMIYTYGSDMGNSEIHHNWIHDNKAYSSGFSLYLDNFTENAVVHHNVIYNGGTGINLNTPGNFKLFYNNTVVNNLKSIDHWGQDPYSEELYGTRMFNNIFTSSVNLTADTVSGFNITSSTGLNFMNPAANDYRIQSGSTAINAGAVIPGITDGYSGTAPDAGAYEFGGTDWTAGHDFAHPPNPSYSAVNTPYMNLLKNSGFELGLANWDLAGAGLATITAVSDTPAWQYRGYTSKLKLGVGVDGVSQTITGLKPNTGYKFVGWVYNDAGEQVNIGVKGYGGSELSTSSTDTEYVRKEVNFTTGASDTSALVYIYKSSTGSGYSYGDDFGLIETTPFSSGASETSLKSVEMTSPKYIYTKKDKGSITLTGKLQNDSNADLSKAELIHFTSSDNNIVSIDSVTGTVATITAKAPGQSTITASVTLGGLTKAVAQIFTVFPKKPDQQGNQDGQGNQDEQNWTVREYGPTARSFLQKDRNSFSLLGMGDNVWGSSDDFVYLSKYIKIKNPNAKVTMTATINSFNSNDPNAAVGLMLRAQDTIDSKHVHFRLDGLGGLRYVYRNQESILDAQKPANEQKYWGSETGVLYIFDKSVTLPVKLKLVKEGSTVTGYYETSTGWKEMGSTTCEFTGKEFLAGIGLYSGKDLTPAKAVISDLNIVTIEHVVPTPTPTPTPVQQE